MGPQYDHDLVAIGLAGLLLLLGHWPDYGVEKAGPGPQGIHSCHFDGCFRLNLLRRRGYTPGYAQLPYRRFFISNQVMVDLDKSSTIDAVDQSKCSTFHADKVLAAESQKVRVRAGTIAIMIPISPGTLLPSHSPHSPHAPTHLPVCPLRTW